MIAIAAGRAETLTFRRAKLYLVSGVLIAGNVLAPVMLHQIGSTGRVLLPIYFFSLVAGLRYGWRCGLITALVSPLLSFWLTAMPARPIIGWVIVKSIMLGVVGGLAAGKLKNLTLTALVAVVTTQMVAGLMGNFADIVVGYPGLALQILMAPVVARLSLDES